MAEDDQHDAREPGVVPERHASSHRRGAPGARAVAIAHRRPPYPRARACIAGADAAPASAAAPVAPAAQLAVTGGDASATPLLLAAGVFALLAGAGAVAASGMRRRH